MGKAKLKVFGFHMENSAVAYYRMWLPFDELNRQGLCECRRFPDDAGKSSVPMLSNSPNYKKEVGSFEDAGKFADLFLWQRVEHLEHVAIARAMQACYGKPFATECDDDLFSVQACSKAYREYRPQHPGESLDVRPIKPEELSLYRSRKDGLIQADGKGGLFWVTLRGGGNLRENWAGMISQSSGVTTTTDHLCKIFQEYNAYVYVLPNCVDLKRMRKANKPPKNKPKGEVTFAWLGGMQHYDDLVLLREAVPKILETCPEAVFLTTCVIPEFWLEFKTAHPKQFRSIPFAPIQTWPEHLGSQGIDIGLAPLNSARFNDSKSNLKFIEYGALGIPGVYSPCKAYAEVEDGRTGYAARTPDEWADLTIGLIKNAGWRKKIGSAAYSYVADNYDIAQKAVTWKNAYEDIYARGVKLARKTQERAKAGKFE